jgi:imidazole glycerol phosphate synthase subunit HisF
MPAVSIYRFRVAAMDDLRIQGNQIITYSATAKPNLEALTANSSYDLELTKMVKEAVTIRVIASSGAGKEHFSEVFEATDADAALAAGISHREEVPIAEVKEHLREKGIEVR